MTSGPALADGSSRLALVRVLGTLIIINRVRARARVFLLAALVAACGSATPATEPKPPVLAHHTSHTCSDAAHGLEGATRSVREPEQTTFEMLLARCTDDNWPVAALDCFATMNEGDLGRCARELPDRSREELFAALAGSAPSRAGIAVALARLEGVNVGIAQCDEFVTAVKTALRCEEMSVELRVRLGTDTADFWSLPTDRLAADDVKRMATVCSDSLATLRREAGTLACAL